jgi:hypothetical protein
MTFFVNSEIIASAFDWEPKFKFPTSFPKKEDFGQQILSFSWVWRRGLEKSSLPGAFPGSRLPASPQSLIAAILNSSLAARELMTSLR